MAIANPLERDNFFTSETHDQVLYIRGKIRNGYSIQLPAYYRFCRVLASYDIIHLHSFNIILILFLRLLRKPLIYTEHGTFQRENQLNSLKNRIKKRILGRFILRHFCRAVCFNSAWLQMNSDIHHRNSHVVYNGINFNRLEKPSNRHGKTYHFISAGRLVTKKRVDQLIRLLAAAGDLDYIFHIVGDGPEYQNLKELSDTLGLNEKNLFHGLQADVKPFYQNSDLFLLASRGEAFGFTVLESIVNGVLPLIYSWAGGPVEILLGMNDRIISKDDNEMLSNIRYWCEHPEERSLCVEKLQELVSRKFTAQKMATEYQIIYESIIATRE